MADAGVPISRINPPTIQVFSDSQKVLPYSTTAPLPSLHEIAIVVEDGGDQSFDPQDYILFYGQTLNRFEWDASQSAYTNISSPYDTLSCYWLRWNVQNGKRMRVKDGTPVTGNSTLREMFTDRLHLEKDRRNPFKSGLEWSWNLFNENQILFERNFELSGVAGTNASLTAHLLHFDIYYINIPPGEMTLTVNNALVGTTTSGEISATVPISEGSNSFRLEYTVPAPGDTVERSGLDWVALNYPRYTHLIDSEIKIFTEQASGIFHTRYRSGSVSDSILMFDITDPFNVAQIETANDSLFEDTLSAEHKMYYLTRNGFTHAVESIEPAQREIFSTGDGADYIIITRQATESEMLPLKTHREPHNNFVVKIVTVENIFDEFGFGREDPTAIRNFIRFAYTNWQPQPQFILFAGSGYYDYRNLTGNYPVNWVPTFEITDFNNINSRNTDDYFVDLDFTHSRNAPQINPGDDFLTGLWQNRFNSEFLQEEPPRSSDFRTIQPDLPIGRLPADTPAELSTLVTKIIDSEINYQPGLWRLNTLLIADDQNSPSSGNDFFFTELLERFWKRRLPRSFRTFKL
ncbi:MAG: hypothetical protein GWN14_01275, partial [candidate division Zixibacteria bacterium]|nr:hypothetical protein [candidate division Zixibacteria bacterium]NIX54590.1 hypothetical protein [candidate division Zixibacteria bacterium]